MDNIPGNTLALILSQAVIEADKDSDAFEPNPDFSANASLFDDKNSCMPCSKLGIQRPGYATLQSSMESP